MRENEYRAGLSRWFSAGVHVEFVRRRVAVLKVGNAFAALHSRSRKRQRRACVVLGFGGIQRGLWRKIGKADVCCRRLVSDLGRLFGVFGDHDTTFL
ncbi:hypothetical protein [Achromobacter sp. AGC39]